MNDLTGTWIGSTRENDLVWTWRVTQRDDNVFVYATFNDQTVPVYYYSGHVTDGVMHINGNPIAVAVPLSAEHFVLRAWEDGRDMLFCRQGIAQLMVEEAWGRYDMNMRGRLV
jgi:hypothetical protein